MSGILSSTTVKIELITVRTNQDLCLFQYFTSPDGDVAEAYAKEAALPVLPSITVADFDEEDLAGPHGHKRKRDEVMEADAQDPTPVATEPASSKSKTDERPQFSEAKEPKSGKSKSKNKFTADLLPLRVMPKVKLATLEDYVR